MPPERSFITLVAFLLCALTCVHGERAVLQLPPYVVSRMSGEWGVEIHSPCDPLISGGTLTFENNGVVVQWNPGPLPGPLLEAAPEGAATFDASGLVSFLGVARATEPMLYTVCEHQTNTIDTPSRPGFEEGMKSTELSEYSGLLSRTEGEKSDCKTSLPDVFIRTVGRDVRDLKETHWRVKESLQYIEVEFDMGGVAGSCADNEGRTTERQEPAGWTRASYGRQRRRRKGLVAETDSRPDGVADKNPHKRCIIMKFARRTLPTKSFYERYYPTLLFVGLMVVYRAIYGFTSYRMRRK